MHRENEMYRYHPDFPLLRFDARTGGVSHYANGVWRRGWGPYDTSAGGTAAVEWVAARQRARHAVADTEAEDAWPGGIRPETT